eukprot:11958327-Karenia_brevis.AAC.2
MGALTPTRPPPCAHSLDELPGAGAAVLVNGASADFGPSWGSDADETDDEDLNAASSTAATLPDGNLPPG